jgi:uncharacterized phage protein (TIGR01671 family)
MRDIRFRAWDVSDSSWFSIGEIAILNDGRVIKFDEEGKYTELGKKRFAIQQFTGLKDKNGKEIWEGDIVLISPEDAHEHDGDCEAGCTWGSDEKKQTVVEWSSEWAGFVWDEAKLFDGEYMYSFASYPYTYEVIGNFYENPDLIKK